MDAMKLFVWEDVLSDYTSGAMFAVARSVEEAREAVLRADPDVRKRELAGEPRVFDMSEAVGFAVWGGG